MQDLTQLLSSYRKLPIGILGSYSIQEEYTPIDLSIHNPELDNLNITKPEVCEEYINSVLTARKAKVAYGGYLEERNLYADKASFSKNTASLRTIHLGVDFWCAAGTSVIVPVAGVVHSFKNNNVIGDYGPTIILEHQLAGITFYTLYGHLSVASLKDLFIGKKYVVGALLGYLGTTDINVNYAPHLHFQVIRDMGSHTGDYPGVCTKADVEFYKNNCPNPDSLLKISS